MTTIAYVISGHKTKKHGIKYICVVYIIKVLQWRLENNGMQRSYPLVPGFQDYK